MLPIESKFQHSNNSSNNGNLANFASKFVKEATLKDCISATKGSKNDGLVKVCDGVDRKQEGKPYFRN
jgi:hypothetical protein